MLVIEDDVRLAGLIREYLGQQGLRVQVLTDGGGALDALQRFEPDLVLLDLGLPGEDGHSICRRIRPLFPGGILILTARESDIDHVLGLELGADDFIVKPVDPRVLLARMQALLRRTRQPVASGGRQLVFGQLSIQLASRSVRLRGETLELSRVDFDLLVLLASNAGIVMTRDALFRQLFGREYDGVDRLLDIRISHLRRRLGEDGERSQGIKTVWGRGYLFVPDAWEREG